MCGIAGVLRHHGEPDPTLLTDMANRFAHRGPDDRGTYVHGSLGLVHTRLSIIDVSGGHQPLFARDGRLVLVANGEIYNHVELRSELEQRGHRFSTLSDCETILHAYVEYGDGFLQHLMGMFAFALYDADRDRLLLARDRLGIKPLYVAQTADGPAFASELKALLAVPCLSRELHPAALMQYLQNDFISGRQTLFRDVEQVLPGELWVLSSSLTVHRQRYWSIFDTTPMPAEPNLLQHQFDGLMDTVIRQHMRSDVPYGLLLSGGLDSSLLLALLDRYSEQPLRSFSVGYPDSDIIDNLPTASRLAQRFDTIHNRLEPDGGKLYRRLPHSIWAADSLMLDYASLPTSLLGERCGDELKVVFTGEGGDEAFAGYGRYRLHGIVRGLRGLWRPSSGGFRVRGLLRGRWPRRLLSEALWPIRHSWRDPFIKSWQSSPRGWSDLQRMQAVDITTALPDNLLVKVDRMLMVWGVEGRVPLLDHRVVEFGLGLADGMKLERNQGKAFLKHWAEDLLPGVNFWKKKRGFSVPVGDWFSSDFLARLQVRLPADPAIAHWLRPQGVGELIDAQRRGAHLQRPIWTLLQFALWHRMFVAGNGQPPPAELDPLELLA